MAKQCTICGKTSTMVWQRSRLRAGKYNPTTKKRQYPNLQWTRLLSGSRRDKSLLLPANFCEAKVKIKKKTKFSSPSLRSGKRVLACAKCIKAMAK